jgi:hypothetical protein
MFSYPFDVLELQDHFHGLLKSMLVNQPLKSNTPLNLRWNISYQNAFRAALHCTDNP